MRTRIKDHGRIRVVLVIHPPTADISHGPFPFVILTSVRYNQNLVGCGEFVAGLRCHDHVTSTDDAHFQRKTLGRMLVVVFSSQGLDPTAPPMG